MAKLFNIFIRPKGGVLRNQIEKKLDLGLDWIRYADGCYLIYSSKPASVWSARLKPFVDPGGHLFIINTDPDQYAGWMPKNLWTWIEDKKKKIYGDSD
jgi:hypothetical protein